MENWKVFKETPWELGSPRRTGEYVVIGVGKTLWKVSDQGNITREHWDHTGAFRDIKTVVQHWKGRAGAEYKLLGIPTGEYTNRLVALQFVPNPEGYKYLEYIDGDRTNNAAANIRWVQKPCRTGRVKAAKKENN